MNRKAFSIKLLVYECYLDIVLFTKWKAILMHGMFWYYNTNPITFITNYKSLYYLSELYIDFMIFFVKLE